MIDSSNSLFPSLYFCIYLCNKHLSVYHVLSLLPNVAVTPHSRHYFLSVFRQGYLITAPRDYFKTSWSNQLSNPMEFLACSVTVVLGNVDHPLLELFLLTTVKFWCNSNSRMTYLLSIRMPQTSGLGPLFFWSSSPSWTISPMWGDSHIFLSRLTFSRGTDIWFHPTPVGCLSVTNWKWRHHLPKLPLFPYFLSWLLLFVSWSIMAFTLETDAA